jgi:hypothetical protein
LPPFDPYPLWSLNGLARPPQPLRSISWRRISGNNRQFSQAAKTATYCSMVIRRKSDGGEGGDGPAKRSLAGPFHWNGLATLARPWAEFFKGCLVCAEAAYSGAEPFKAAQLAQGLANLGRNPSAVARFTRRLASLESAARFPANLGDYRATCCVTRVAIVCRHRSSKVRGNPFDRPLRLAPMPRPGVPMQDYPDTDISEFQYPRNWTIQQLPGQRFSRLLTDCHK